jgi:hypothetical protein
VPSRGGGDYRPRRRVPRSGHGRTA